MATITIDYSDLGKLIKKAGNAASELEDYSEEIEKQFRKKLTSLDGDDAASNISTARELAKEKQKKLMGHKANFVQLSKDLSSLEGTAKAADSTVKRKIESVAKPYENNQSFFQKIGSAVYGFFCDVGDLISNVPLVDMLVNAVSKAWTALKSVKEYVSDWFKYGAGKYVANIIKSVTAVVGVVLAMAGAIVGAPAWLAAIALVAGSIALLYAFGNMMVTTEENMRAMEQHKKGRRGLARFYGGIDSINKWTHRTDFGGKSANRAMEIFGGFHEIAGKTATYVLTICSTVNAVHQLRAVKNSKTGKVIRYQNVYHKDGSVTPVIGKNLESKLKPKGLMKFLFGENKSIAFWSKDITKSYEGTINLLSLINGTTNTALEFYGGKDTFIDDIKTLTEEPTLANFLKATKSTMGNFFMPEYIKSNFKFFVPQVAIGSDREGMITAFGGLISDVGGYISEDLAELRMILKYGV